MTDRDKKPLIRNPFGSPEKEDAPQKDVSPIQQISAEDLMKWQVERANQKIKALEVLVRQTATDYVDRSKVEITKGDTSKDLAIAGKIVGHDNCTFEVKVFDKGSEYGIDYGRISKLTIWENGLELANYSRGWSEEPDDYHVKALVDQVVEAFPTRHDMTPIQARDAYVQETTRERTADIERIRDR